MSVILFLNGQSEWNNGPYIDKKGNSFAISQGINNYDCVIIYTLNLIHEYKASVDLFGDLWLHKLPLS